MPDLYPNLGNKRLRIPEAIEEREEKLYQDEQKKNQRADKDEADQMQAWDKFVLKAYKANGSSAKQKLIGEYSKMYQDRGWGEFSVKDFVPKNEHFIEIVENDSEEEDGEARYFANVSGKTVQDRLRRYTDSPEKVIHYSELLTNWGKLSPIQKARKLNEFRDEDPESYEILKEMQSGRKSGNRFTEINTMANLYKGMISTLNTTVGSLDKTIGDPERLEELRMRLSTIHENLNDENAAWEWRKDHKKIKQHKEDIERIQKEINRIENSKISKDQKVKEREKYINELFNLIDAIGSPPNNENNSRTPNNKDKEKKIDSEEYKTPYFDPENPNYTLQPIAPTILKQDSKMRLPGNGAVITDFTNPKTALKEEIKIDPETKLRTSDNPEFADMLQMYYSDPGFQEKANEVMPVIAAKIEEEEDEEQVFRMLEQLYLNYRRSFDMTPTIGESRELAKQQEEMDSKIS